MFTDMLTKIFCASNVVFLWVDCPTHAGQKWTLQPFTLRSYKYDSRKKKIYIYGVHTIAFCSEPFLLAFLTNNNPHLSGSNQEDGDTNQSEKRS